MSSLAQAVKDSRHRLNDIGPIPAVVNPDRREACRFDFKLFCETYFPEACYLGWADFHLYAIKKIEDVILHHSRYAWAMPRGSGKTTIARIGVVWGLLYGHIKYPVIIGSDAGAAENILSAINTILSSPGDLADDFPEVCFPLLKLEGKSQATHSQTCQGERTRMTTKASKMVLPTIKGSPSSGSIIQAFGLTGGIRGAFHQTEEGRILRPDTVILDDPSTDESAASDTQNKTREEIIRKSVMKMNAPDTKMAAMMPCTIIRKHDLAYRFLDRSRNPAWLGTVTKMVPQMPKNLEFWEVEYRRVWEEGLLTEGDNGDKANIFYMEHREKLEEGAKVSWLDRIEGNDITALQSAMHIYLDDKDSFHSEYQNDPLDGLDGEDNILQKPELEKRCLKSIKVKTVPTWCRRLVAHADVGTSSGIHYTVLGIGERFQCSVITKGHVRAKFKGLTPEAGIIKGLNQAIERCTIPFKIDGGNGEMVIEIMGIDAGYKPDAIYRVCREHEHSAILRPTKGEGVKPGKSLFRTRDKQSQSGEGWIYGPVKNSTRPVRLLRFDANHWKTFVFNRATGIAGAPGSMVFCGEKDQYREYFDHLTAEYRERVTVDSNDYDQWSPLVNRQNHYFDTLVGACLMGNYLGEGLDGDADVSKSRGRRKKRVIRKKSA